MICDELAFWSDDENSANPAEDVIAAVRPGMATVRNPKLIKISTPYREDWTFMARISTALRTRFSSLAVKHPGDEPNN